MAANVSNQVAFLRTSRNFPYHDIKELTVELNKMYIDMSAAVNSRIISLFTTTMAAINGETWFILNNQRQQGFRKVFTFTTTNPITHNIMVTNAGQFIRCFGSFTDGTNTYGLIFGSNVAIAGQISFFVSATQIIFELGAGHPTLTSGVIVLEWLSQP